MIMFIKRKILIISFIAAIIAFVSSLLCLITIDVSIWGQTVLTILIIDSLFIGLSILLQLLKKQKGLKRNSWSTIAYIWISVSCIDRKRQDLIKLTRNKRFNKRNGRFLICNIIIINNLPAVFMLIPKNTQLCHMLKTGSIAYGAQKTRLGIWLPT